MGNVSVLIPYRPDAGHRGQALEWVLRQWADRHPDWQVVVGQHTEGPWCKAIAVADALTHADCDLLVLADADVWCDRVDQAVDAVHRGAPWAIPHGRVHRLDASATGLVLAGTHPAAINGRLARAPYRGVEGGGMTVLPRATYEQVPFDPRFKGWGQEDESHGLALTTLAGRPWRGTAHLWHLWHEPQVRLNQHVGNAAGHALHVRYQYASRDRATMRALVNEQRVGSL